MAALSFISGIATWLSCTEADVRRIVKTEDGFVLQRYERCIAFFAQLVEKHPDAANAYLNLAFAHVDKIPAEGAITQVLLANTSLGHFGTALELEEMSEEYAGKITIAKLNVDENPQTAMQYDVMSIPTMIVYTGGAERKRIVGARPKPQLLDTLSEYLN